jgi:hypothetical protein
MRAAGNVVRLVTLTKEEEAAIERPSPIEDAKAATGHASWKFSLLETLNADPKANSACLAVAGAYLPFTSRDRREAYLSEADLRARTGGLKGIQPATLRKAKRTLSGLGYMTPIGKTAAGIIVYRFDNPRAEIVADHVRLTAETLKDLAAEKRALERLRRRPRGLGINPPQKAAGGLKSTGTGGSKSTPNTVEHTVDNNLYETGGLIWGIPIRDPWGVIADATAAAARISSRKALASVEGAE